MKLPRATRLVICCRGTADEAMAAMRGMMSRLKLTVNEAKTRLCRVPEETFDFLGYTIGRCYSPQTGQSYIGTRPSAKKIARLRRRDPRADRPSLALDGVSRTGWRRLNRKLLGWSNYFCLGPVSAGVPCRGPARAATGSAGGCARKHKVRGRGTSRFPDQYLHDVLGLVRLSGRTQSFPWANA